MRGRLKQVPKGESFTVDVFDGGLAGKCVYAKYGYLYVEEAKAEIDRMKFKFAKDGVDTTNYLYIIRPVETYDWVYDDEYINYARYLACIVPEQASVREIYDYLRDCEVNSMGLDGDKAITMDVAQRLYEIGQGIILAGQ